MFLASKEGHEDYSFSILCEMKSDIIFKNIFINARRMSVRIRINTDTRAKGKINL